MSTDNPAGGFSDHSHTNFGSPNFGSPVGNSGLDTYKKAHKLADTDAEQGSIHHTLGLGPYQAAPGTVVKALKEQTTDLIGEVKLWILPVPPPNFLLCEGQTLSTTDYPELFAVVGYTWGGVGATFKLPDARTRLLMGADSAAADIGESEGIASPASRNLYQNHPHVHNINIGATSAATISGNTTSNGSHSHSFGAYTDVTGAHVHSSGTPSGTQNVTSGGVSAAGPNHTHSIGLDGNHQHFVSAAVISDSGHSHSLNVGLPAHSHSGVSDSNTSAQHPYLKMGVIIRYQSGIDL